MIQEGVLKALNDAKTKRKLQNKTVTKPQQQKQHSDVKSK